MLAANGGTTEYVRIPEGEASLPQFTQGKFPPGYELVDKIPSADNAVHEQNLPVVGDQWKQ